MKNNLTHGAIGAAVNISGPQGAMGPYTTSSGSNGPPGPYIITSATVNPSVLSISSSQSKEVLRITPSGEVLWLGKPSEASDVLKNILANLIDEKIKPSMRQRTYVRACKSILAKAKTMEKDELIEFLEKSIQNRKSKEILLSLKDT